MRRLHAVSRQERFLASGVYAYYRGSMPTGLVEHWSIHEVDGAQFVRADRDGRAFDGRSVLYEALRNPDGRLERVDWRAFRDAGGVSEQIKSSFTFYENSVETIRIVNSEMIHEDVVNLPDGYEVEAGAQILTGDALVQAASRQGDAVPLLIVAPRNVEEPTAPAALTTRRVTWGESSAVDVAGRTVDARRYDIHQDEMSSHAWIDPFAILLRWESEELACMLTQYARRPASV